LRLFSNKNHVYGILVVWYALITVISTAPLQAGDYAASFLSIGVGPRGLGMGSACCSITNDTYSFFWNPAGLAMLGSREVSGMYGPQFGTLADPMANFNAVSLGMPLKNGAAISVNWVRLAIDDIPLYGELAGDSYYERLHNMALRPDGSADGFMNDAENAIIFTFAKMNKAELNLGWLYNKLVLRIPFGVNFKWVRQKLGEHSASGFSIDAGVQMHIDMAETFDLDYLGFLSWGLFLRNMTGLTVQWDTNHRDEVGASAVWGVSYTMPLLSNTHQVCISADTDNEWTRQRRIGIEFARKDRYSLRAGISEHGFTTGAGIYVWKMVLDYAFLSHELDNLHRIGCRIRF